MPLSLVPIADPQIAAQASPNATTILQLQSGIAWRQYLKRASFRSVPFFVDTGVRESGRRTVAHEFPKRNVPYAEDMGRRAREFTVRGYIIVYPHDADDLRKKNYIEPRDKLITALETDGSANLQLPLLGILNVMCTRYRVTEEDRLGGYCVFDMSFVEYGQAPANGTRDSAAGVYYAASALDITAQGFTATGIVNSGGAAAPATSGNGTNV
jgi:prophage DNA circulation protein